MGDRDNCQCECNDALREKLEDHKGELIVIYERNGSIVFGNLEKVGDVVKFDNAIKITSFGSCVSTAQASKVFVSLCEITEFLAGNIVLSINCDVDAINSMLAKAMKPDSSLSSS
ncbi:hypothetical protein [Bacillus sp. Marseille-Q1617]|uniref:hypothetical protein n=1 Tax=Bacillus sp. Marseille-Q1617 TaxID=2736887 RepID=UPI00158B3D1B|nr:hypothetical protein [Bacillus sp. Marseille-Q1617]